MGADVLAVTPGRSWQRYRPRRVGRRVVCRLAKAINRARYRCGRSANASTY